MVLLSLFSGSLFILPVAVTVGTYIGIESQKVIDVVHGKPPANVNPDGTPRIVGTSQYCQKAFGFQPFPNRYIYNPNQWGDPDNTGALCLEVTTDSSAKSDDLYAFNWTATWGYPQGPLTEPVHAYPNAKLNDTAFPIQVSNINTLTMDIEWNYAVGDIASTSTDLGALSTANLNANIAVDLFLSDDKIKAENSTLATHEVMVWLGKFGAATQPLGYSPTPTMQYIIGATQFSLYNGVNSAGQQVFTWVASQNTTQFNGDVSPLIKQLSTITGGPTDQTYLGYYAFGSEVFYATGNMTLSVPKMGLEVNGS